MNTINTTLEKQTELELLAILKADLLNFKMKQKDKTKNEQTLKAA
ncbi:hypothetical protein [Pedobacter sp. SYSU D00535]|nr:hypothetical protein [Pedobacter sp. SYSU D00535]